MKNVKNLTMMAFLAIASISLVFTSCNPDACKDVVCNNGGVCTDGSCSCAAGFEGSECETQSLSKLLGTNNTSQVYTFADNGGTTCGNFTGTFTATRSSADTTRVILTNFGGFGATTYIYGTVNENTLTIPTQTINGATNNTVSGSGTYSSGVISGSYTNDDGTSTCTYAFTWTKQ